MLIRVKKKVQDRIVQLLNQGEILEIIIPCGKMHFREGTIERPEDRDYLVVTNKRVIMVSGNWFIGREGIRNFLRHTIKGVEIRNFLLGCTVTLKVYNETSGQIEEVLFENCGKPEGESVLKNLSTIVAIPRCPACFGELQEDFTFCPFCKTNLKNVCKNCGKILEAGWRNCPYCGN